MPSLLPPRCGDRTDGVAGRVGLPQQGQPLLQLAELILGRSPSKRGPVWTPRLLSRARPGDRRSPVCRLSGDTAGLSGLRLAAVAPEAPASALSIPALDRNSGGRPLATVRKLQGSDRGATRDRRRPAGTQGRPHRLRCCDVMAGCVHLRRGALPWRARETQGRRSARGSTVPAGGTTGTTRLSVPMPRRAGHRGSRGAGAPSRTPSVARPPRRRRIRPVAAVPWRTHCPPPAGAGSVVNRCGGGWSAVADAPSAPSAPAKAALTSDPANRR